MRRYLTVCGVLAVGAAMASCKPSTETPAATATTAQTAETVEIQWFTGLGMEIDSNRQNAQQAVVDAFNATVGRENNIRLTLETVYSGLARDTLAARIEAGEGPDIVGPTGMVAASAFSDQWLDLDPYIAMSGFDTSVFPAALLDIYQPEGKTTALPFMANPSVVFYNVSLFNRYGYAYPPAQYGKGYLMPDGHEAVWSWDTLAELARLMTIDGSGNHAGDPGFDGGDIRQYGFTWQGYNHPNYWGGYWSDGSMWEEGRKAAKTPEEWKIAWQWTYDAIWGETPFMADASAEESPAFGDGAPFNSGKVAMAVTPFQYADYLGEEGTWDIAVLPSYEGAVSGRIEEAAFRILQTSRYPQEAFTVLQYLATAAVDPLLIGDEETPAAYDGVPAAKDKQETWKTAKAAIFSTVFHLNVVLDNLNRPAALPTELYMPNYPQAWARGNAFADRLRTTDGLDLEAEITAYEEDLTAIFAESET
jgi:multiple sugar transport system substrate-binding protein